MYIYTSNNLQQWTSLDINNRQQQISTEVLHNDFGMSVHTGHQRSKSINPFIL